MYNSYSEETSLAKAVVLAPLLIQNYLQSGSFICAHQESGKFRAKSIKKHVLPLQPGQK